MAQPELPAHPLLTLTEYEGLASFRHHVRRFFAFSERAIEQAGLSAAQYQGMLAIKAHAGPPAMMISDLSERLLIRLNSAVELVGRLEAGGLVRRERSIADRRRIELSLTAHGEEVLAPLAREHLDKHREHLPDLMRLLAVLKSDEG